MSQMRADWLQQQEHCRDLGRVSRPFRNEKRSHTRKTDNLNDNYYKFGQSAAEDLMYGKLLNLCGLRMQNFRAFFRSNLSASR